MTDEAMTRFVMTTSQAINALFKAAEIVQGGETFIPKMKSVKIMDLINVVVEEFSPQYECDVNSLKIELIGKKPGEKVFEEILTQSEAERSLETEELFIVVPEYIENLSIGTFQYPNAKPLKSSGLRSDDVHFLSKKEIKTLLIKEHLL